jgi:hypothetical protein
LIPYIENPAGFVASAIVNALLPWKEGEGRHEQFRKELEDVLWKSVALSPSTTKPAGNDTTRFSIPVFRFPAGRARSILNSFAQWHRELAGRFETLTAAVRDPMSQSTKLPSTTSEFSLVLKTAAVVIPLVAFWAAESWATSGGAAPWAEWLIQNVTIPALLGYLGFLGYTAFSHHARIKVLENVVKWRMFSG